MPEQRVEPSEPPPPVAPPEWPAPEPLAADAATMVAMRTRGGGNIKLNATEERMLELHNSAQRERGLGTLCVSPELTGAARAHSADMLARAYFAHVSPGGAMPEHRTKHLRHYDVGNENIALGSGHMGSPENRFAGFMNSPGQRTNILRADYSEVGIGAVAGEYKGYEGESVIYTVEFGGWL